MQTVCYCWKCRICMTVGFGIAPFAFVIALMFILNAQMRVEFPRETTARVFRSNQDRVVVITVYANDATKTVRYSPDGHGWSTTWLSQRNGKVWERNMARMSSRGFSHRVVKEHFASAEAKVVYHQVFGKN